MRYIFILFILLSSLYAKTYEFSGGKNNPVQIIGSKILKVAYTRAHISMKPKFVQLQVALELSNSGITDGELVRIKKINNTYKNLLIVPVPLVTVEAMAFSKDSSIHINKWSDLKNYNFTIIRGAKFIEKSTQHMNKEFVNNFQEAFENLDTNETQIVVVPKLAGLKSIFLNNYYDIKPVSKPLQSLKLYHFVHKKNKHLIKIITPILQTMKETGEITYWQNAYLRSITPH